MPLCTFYCSEKVMNSVSVETIFWEIKKVVAKVMGVSEEAVIVNFPALVEKYYGELVLEILAHDTPERRENIDDRALAIKMGLEWLFETIPGKELRPFCVDLALVPFGIWSHGDPERAAKLLE